MSKLEKQTLILDRLIESLHNDSWIISCGMNIKYGCFFLELCDIAPDRFIIRVDTSHGFKLFQWDKKTLITRYNEACDLASKMLHASWAKDEEEKLDNMVKATEE